MRRDMELCRKILLGIEEHGEPFEVFFNSGICGYSEKEIGFHTHLLAQAGLIEATDGWASTNRPWVYYATNITWNGYEFLDAARDDKVWKSALEGLGSKAASIPFELLKTCLVEVLKDTLFQSG